MNEIVFSALSTKSAARPGNRRRKAPSTWWWAGEDSNLRRRTPADLQSAPFGRLGTDPVALLGRVAILSIAFPGHARRTQRHVASPAISVEASGVPAVSARRLYTAIDNRSRHGWSSGWRRCWPIRSRPTTKRCTVSAISWLRAVGAHSWSVARGDTPLPVLTLDRGATLSNIQLMQGHCNARGCLLAPHGKTTMAPQPCRSSCTPTRGGSRSPTSVTRGRYLLRRPPVVVANEVTGRHALAILRRSLRTARASCSHSLTALATPSCSPSTFRTAPPSTRSSARS